MNVDERGCERAKDVAGFLDDALEPTSMSTMGEHVLACDSCLEELKQLQGVRDLLGRRGGSQPSSALESRLLSIAGEDTERPLWMPKGMAGALPSKRGQRVRFAATMSASAAVVVCVVLGLAFLMSPDVKTITDPGKSARKDLTAAWAGIGQNEASALLVMAQDDGIALERTTSITGLATPNGQRVRVSNEFANGLLATTALGYRTITGVQRVSLETAAGGVTASVRTTEDRTGVSLKVVGALGADVYEGFFQRTKHHPARRFGADVEYYTYPAAMNSVIGQPTTVVEARATRRLVARWWIASDGYLLWSERFGTDGRRTMASGFTQMSATSSPSVVSANIEVAAKYQSDTSVKCSGWADCPRKLAGLDLVAFGESGLGDSTLIHATYSNGLSTICVVMRPGWLPNTMKEHRSYGVVAELAWQSGATVIEVSTNGSQVLLDLAAAQLPHEPAVTPDLAWQLGEGFKRLIGATRDRQT